MARRRSEDGGDDSSEVIQQSTPEIVAPGGGDRDMLMSLLSELAGQSGARVTVYRATRNQPMAYMFQCAPDAFSLDDLRDRYNGGEFRVYIIRDGVLWRNVRVVVEPKAVGAAVDTAVPSATADMLAAMREGFDRQSELLRAALTAQQRPAGVFGSLDLPATITAIASAISALRPPPIPPPPPLPAATDQIDILLKGIELARELRESATGDGEPTLMGMMRDLVRSPLLAQAVASMQPPAPPTLPSRLPPVPMRPPTPLPPPAAPAPPTPPVQQSLTESPMIDPQILMYLGILVSKAAQDSDPALYAEVILDTLPVEFLDQFLRSNSDPVAALAQFHAPVLLHRAWFEGLVAVLRDEISQNEVSNGDIVGASDLSDSHATGAGATDVPGGTSAR